MADDLAQMIQETEVEQSEQSTNLDIEQNDQPVTELPDAAVDVTEFEITTVSLATWFGVNHQNFSNVNPVNVQVRDVEPDHTLVFTVDNPRGLTNEEGRTIKLIETFKNANTFPVLNLPGHSMNVFGNGFVIIYDYEQGRYLKCYGVKTGLITFYCISIDGNLVPYAKTKLKKKDLGLDMIEPDNEGIAERLGTELDSEGLQIQYRQVQKFISDISTKSEAIAWLGTKSQEVTDINHLMQIDDVLMWLVS